MKASSTSAMKPRGGSKASMSSFPSQKPLREFRLVAPLLRDMPHAILNAEFLTTASPLGLGVERLGRLGHVLNRHSPGNRIVNYLKPKTLRKPVWAEGPL